MVPEGECCPICFPDCSLVRCALPICPIGQKAMVPEGECCPECVPDCSAVSCLKPVCLARQVLKVPDGKCCPECIGKLMDSYISVLETLIVVSLRLRATL